LMQRFSAPRLRRRSVSNAVLCCSRSFSSFLVLRRHNFYYWSITLP
jgi:hypothetical protein